MRKRIISRASIVAILTGIIIFTGIPHESAIAATIVSLNNLAPSTPMKVRMYSMDTNNSVLVGWSPLSEAVDKVTYQISVDSGDYSIADYYRINDILFFDTPPLMNGIHTIALRARDMDGNVSDLVVLSATIIAQGVLSELMIDEPQISIQRILPNVTSAEVAHNQREGM